MKERTKLNKILLSIYLILYVFAPPIFLIYSKENFKMPDFFNNFFWASGFGVLLFVISSFIFILNYFPQVTGRAILIIIPTILNHVIYFLIYGFNETLKELSINSNLVFSSFVFSILICILFIPIHSKKKSDKKKIIFLEIFTAIKKEPYLLIPFIILIIPIFAAIYYFIMGFIITLNGASFSEKKYDLALYLSAFINITIFHLREMKKQSQTTN